MKWRKKRKNTERQKKENKWIEDEQKEGIKRQNRHSKRENVELEKGTHHFSLSEKKRDSKNGNYPEKRVFLTCQESM